jgi:hypothetical protein
MKTIAMLHRTNTTPEVEGEQIEVRKTANVIVWPSVIIVPHFNGVESDEVFTHEPARGGDGHYYQVDPYIVEG